MKYTNKLRRSYITASVVSAGAAVTIGLGALLVPGSNALSTLSATGAQFGTNTNAHLVGDFYNVQTTNWGNGKSGQPQVRVSFNGHDITPPVPPASGDGTSATGAGDGSHMTISVTNNGSANGSTNGNNTQHSSVSINSNIHSSNNGTTSTNSHSTTNSNNNKSTTYSHQTVIQNGKVTTTTEHSF